MKNLKERIKKASKPKKVKKKTTSQLKREADRVFSLYIRQKYADKSGNVPCYTCGKVLAWNRIQNGHFISRGYLATRYLEDNCRPQDVGCNVFGGGRPVEFARKLEEETPGITAELYRKAQKIEPNFNYSAIIYHYSALLLALR